MKVLVVIEKTRTGFSAYSPDVQGCIATGRTHKRIERAMQKAIEVHLNSMRVEGVEVPTPRSYSTYMEVRSDGGARSPAPTAPRTVVCRT